MIAAAERDGRTIVASLMFTPQGRITTDAAALLEYGFATAGKIAPVGQLVEPLSAAVLSEFDEAAAARVSTNDIRDDVSGLGAAADSFPLRFSAMTGGLMTVVLLGLLALWPVLKRRNRFARAGAYR